MQDVIEKQSTEIDGLKTTVDNYNKTFDDMKSLLAERKLAEEALAAQTGQHQKDLDSLRKKLNIKALQDIKTKQGKEALEKTLNESFQNRLNCILAASGAKVECHVE